MLVTCLMAKYLLSVRLVSGVVEDNIYFETLHKKCKTKKTYYYESDLGLKLGVYILKKCLSLIVDTVPSCRRKQGFFTAPSFFLYYHSLVVLVLTTPSLSSQHLPFQRHLIPFGSLLWALVLDV